MGKPFCLRMVRWFFPGLSGFRPPLLNDQLDRNEIFLKGLLNPNQKKKKKKIIIVFMDATILILNETL